MADTTFDTKLEAVLRRDRYAVLAALLLLTALAWGYVIWLSSSMSMPAASMPGMNMDMGAMAPMLRPWSFADFLFSFLMWAVMMAGMMLPSAAPVILLVLAAYRRRGGRRAHAVSAAFIDDRPHLVLTVRSDRVRHGGQVSLPGGVVEPGETYAQAALREAYEEVAFTAQDVAVLGTLTPLDIPVSGFRLHPVVAMMDARPELKAADGEVAAILEVAVDDLLDRDHLTNIERERDGRRIIVPALRTGGHEIWGATAMVLAEFLVLLDWDPRLPSSR